MRDRSERVAFKVCHVNNKLYLTCGTIICETCVIRELDMNLRLRVEEPCDSQDLIICIIFYKERQKFHFFRIL